MEDSLQIDNRAPATVKVIVSPGRTVQTGNPYRVVEYETGGVKRWAKAPVEGAKKTQFTEGEEVELPIEEAHRLVALGFCYFPEAKPAFSRPLGVDAHFEPPVERISPDGPTTAQPGDDPDADMGRPIGITQSEPRGKAKQ